MTMRWMFVVAACFCLPAFADDDDDDAPRAASDAIPTLNAEQQQSAGIVIAHPVNASAPLRIDALGVVLDPGELIEDNGAAESADASARAAAAEVARLNG